MNRRNFLKRTLMGAAFVTLSRVLPGSQTEFVAVEEAEPLTTTGAMIAADNWPIIPFGKLVDPDGHCGPITYSMVLKMRQRMLERERQQERWLYEDGRGK